MPEVVTSYHRQLLTQVDWEKKINRALMILHPKRAEFDAIAFRGLSGAGMAPVLCYLLKKNMIYVRKAGPTPEPSHAYQDVEGAKDQRILLLDDFISSGATMRAMMEACQKLRPAKFVAIYLHGTVRTDPWEGIPMWNDENGSWV